MLQAFQQLNFADQQLNRFQDNIAGVFSKLVGPFGVAFLDGVSVRVKLASGANSVAHKLGRAPQGWIVTRIDAAASVYETNASPFSATALALTASAICTVTLWVF